MNSSSSAKSPVKPSAIFDRADSTATYAERELIGGEARTTLTNAGAGALHYAGLAVTRPTRDALCDANGLFFYLRDLDNGRFWTATLQPAGRDLEEYEVLWTPSHARFRSMAFGIEAQLDVSVTTEGVELRRLTITNTTSKSRRIELTSYLEWVLQDAAADAAHPAFSKLFVETRCDERLSGIVARRRQRDPKQPILCGAHWIVDEQPAQANDATSFESDRMAFIGRGRSLREPAALAAPQPLKGRVGPVLDPCASLRRTFYLAPRESAAIIFATAARFAESELLAIAAELGHATTSDFDGRPLTADHAPSHDGQRSNGSSATADRVDAAHLGPSASSFHRLTRADQSDPIKLFSEPLQFDNGVGGFNQHGDEYVIRLQLDDDGDIKLPPLPWSHVAANPNAGFIATERGAGYTWTANSRENRLTYWSNDPVCDPHSEAIYLRDLDSRDYWSPLPGPAEAPVPHEIRYGFGYASYRQTCSGLDQRVVQFVPIQDAVKVSRVSVENNSNRPRRLDAVFYAHLALGNGERNKDRTIETWFDDANQALFATNAARELSHRIAFAALITPEASENLEYTTDRREFIGDHRDLSAPAGVTGGARFSGRRGPTNDACFALKRPLQIEPGKRAEYWILLGEADSAEHARELIARYSDAARLDQAFAEVRQSWQHLLSAVQIQTPSPALNLMVNGWLPYQNISCRLWGRSAYYQSGGAFGFRDQLQDAAALVYHDPSITRRQLLRNAASQFIEGDVLHWWHPPSSRGIRTRFADDLLWLPLAASEYASTTGDADIWNESAPFLTGPQLEPGEQERFFTPQTSGESGTVYEHCCRAIDRSLSLGAHGLPLFGCGDWNDGMNRVGEQGRGESVWMAFFLYYVLDRFIPACRLRFDEPRAERYRDHQQQLRAALDSAGWDGRWYRRAYFDDGSPLGTANADECQIDALAQAWAILSGAAEPAKARQAIDAVDNRLVRPEHGLIQLLDPPFDRMPQDPGYIKGYLPGIRENGGQYTHGVLWFIRAMAELGRGGRAVELLDMVNPIHHGRTPAEVAVYQAEPYVVAADVYSQPPHAGRAGWTWYTGSAGWMLRVAVESILGLSIHEGRELRLNPCISKDWPSCELHYRLPNGRGEYHIKIDNPHGRERGVHLASLDGKNAPIAEGIARIPLSSDGARHEVLLRL